MTPQTRVWINREALIANKENGTHYPAIVVDNTPKNEHKFVHEVVFSNGCGCGHTCDQRRYGRVYQSFDGPIPGTITVVWVELDEPVREIMLVTKKVD